MKNILIIITLTIAGFLSPWALSANIAHSHDNSPSLDGTCVVSGNGHHQASETSTRQNTIVDVNIDGDHFVPLMMTQEAD